MARLRIRSGQERPPIAEILTVLRAHLPELRERYGVKTLGVFGSYARGEQRRASDVDVLGSSTTVR